MNKKTIAVIGIVGIIALGWILMGTKQNFPNLPQLGIKAETGTIIAQDCPPPCLPKTGKCG